MIPRGMAGDVAPSSSSSFTGGAYGVSAGLQLLSGVFGYLSAQAAGDAARSRADMVRAEANANAQRYSEQAAAHIAQTKAMFLASGVTLAGSPIDVLDTQARIANENMESIRMRGDVEALDESQRGDAAEMRGRNALVGGIAGAAGVLGKGFGRGTGFDVANAFTGGS